MSADVATTAEDHAAAQGDGDPSPLCFGDRIGDFSLPVPDRARKRRLEILTGEPAREAEVMAAIAARVLPEVDKAFHFEVGQFERLELVCYRAQDSGHFAVHRDSTAPQTAHRRFALTVNLDTGDYQGGELVSPEYGPGPRYTAPAGGAIVFSGAHAHRVLPATAGSRLALISFMFESAEIG